MVPLVAAPIVLEAVMVQVKVPAAIGAPPIEPVLGLSATPGGSEPVATEKATGAVAPPATVGTIVAITES